MISPELVDLLILCHYFMSESNKTVIGTMNHCNSCLFSLWEPHVIFLVLASMTPSALNLIKIIHEE